MKVAFVSRCRLHVGHRQCARPRGHAPGCAIIPARAEVIAVVSTDVVKVPAAVALAAAALSEACPRCGSDDTVTVRVGGKPLAGIAPGSLRRQCLGCQYAFDSTEATR